MRPVIEDMTAFLAARLDEDEAAAETGRERDLRPLREVAAKRAILAEHFAEDRGESLPGADCGVCYYIGTPGSPAQWPCLTLRVLAAVYSDHPDYRQEWKP